MKKQLLLLTAILGIGLVSLTSFKMFHEDGLKTQSFHPAYIAPNEADFVKQSEPGKIMMNNKSPLLITYEIGDFEVGGEVYAIYGDGYGNISGIYFLDGPAVYAWSGYVYGHAGGTWADVKVYPTGPGTYFIYNGALAFY